MISAEEARDLMPSLRKGTIMDEVEELIVEAANADRKAVKLPKGFFGTNVEQDVMYNAKTPPLYSFVHDELIKSGYKLGRNVEGLYFVITWG
jgi:hypothetical protein